MHDPQGSIATCSESDAKISRADMSFFSFRVGRSLKLLFLIIILMLLLKLLSCCCSALSSSGSCFCWSSPLSCCSCCLALEAFWPNYALEETNCLTVCKLPSWSQTVSIHCFYRETMYLDDCTLFPYNTKNPCSFRKKAYYLECISVNRNSQ